MKITDLSVRRFRYISNTERDSEGHGHPGPDHEAVQSVLTIHTDEGAEGYFFGGPPQALIDSLVKPYITGEDPFLPGAHLAQSEGTPAAQYGYNVGQAAERGGPGFVGPGRAGAQLTGA